MLFFPFLFPFVIQSISDLDKIDANTSFKNEKSEEKSQFKENLIKETKCLGNNTVKNDETGECECDEDFIYGDPNSIQGCWDCFDCATESVCLYPGICKCKEGYIGNGIACVKEYPKIIDVEPKLIPLSEKFDLKVTFSNIDADLIKGNYLYISVGDNTISPYRISENKAFASITIEKPGIYPVKISSDYVVWSRENISVSCLQREEQKSNKIGIIIAILSILVLIKLISLLRTQISSQETEEELPFIAERNIAAFRG